MEQGRVQAKGNGLGIAGFVCGLVGLILSFVPFAFWLGLILGVLGTVFGAIGWRRAAADPEVPSKGLSIAGTILGVLAVVVFVLWVALIASAVD